MTSTMSFPSFDPSVETVSEFIQRFSVQYAEKLEQAGDNEVKKAAILCRALPVNVITDMQRRLKPLLLTAATYTQLNEILKAQFEVKKSVVGAALKFVSRKQQENESIENFARVLNNLASDCEYKDCCRDRQLRDIFISGLQSNATVKFLLENCEDASFNNCVTKAKLHEQLISDAQDMRHAEMPALTSHRVNNSGASANIPNNYRCIRCATVGKHLANKCFALKMKCHGCGIVGHILKACKKRSNLVERDESINERENDSLATQQVDTASVEHSQRMYGVQPCHPQVASSHGYVEPQSSQHIRYNSFDDSFLA